MQDRTQKVLATDIGRTAMLPAEDLRWPVVLPSCFISQSGYEVIKTLDRVTPVYSSEWRSNRRMSLPLVFHFSQGQAEKQNEAPVHLVKGTLHSTHWLKAWPGHALAQIFLPQVNSAAHRMITRQEWAGAAGEHQWRRRRRRTSCLEGQLPLCHVCCYQRLKPRNHFEKKDDFFGPTNVEIGTWETVEPCAVSAQWKYIEWLCNSPGI